MICIPQFLKSNNRATTSALTVNQDMVTDSV